ncbi:MAG: polysaccharide deacetylase family protein [Bacteroidota bacterium]|jgi:peptidoglycan/xylan/chitin deacetylase (PgdA/CDA1 family)|nr:polysaccharide deacetylase family protein [Bacteroidota bacterium]
MHPELRISIDGVAEFLPAARYTLATMALIAGRRVRFVEENATLHYGPVPVANAVWLPASDRGRDLLARRRIDPDARDIDVAGIRILGLFPVDDTATLPTDIVAAAFYFLSLHEEWTAVEHDQFGRVRATDSLLGRRGETARPVVAEYADVLRAVLGETGGDASPRFGGYAAAAVMTHDIDYLSKWTPGLVLREVGKNFLLNRRKVSFSERWTRFREYLAFRHRSADPYVVSIMRMLEVEQRHGIVASWLFKAGGTDRRDVTYALSSPRARGVFEQLGAAGHDIGLHPSFHAHANARMLTREASRLRTATGVRLRSVRQHYLRFEYPTTWRNQVAEGLFVDSTLGFAEREGFRNGSCHPFLPWDAEARAPLPIWELPLTVMDGTLAHYRGLSNEAAERRIAEMLDIAANARGVAVLLFHNTSYDAHDFPGWGKIFERTAARIADGRFLTRPLPVVVEEWLASAGYASTEEFLQVINPVPVG